MKNKKKTIEKVIFVIILICFAIFYQYMRGRVLDAEKSNFYTVGVFIDTYVTSNSGHGFEFYYIYNGKKHIGTGGYDSYRDTNPEKGQRYYVSFVPDDIEMGFMHLDKPVHDSVQVIPPQGWKGNLDSLFIQKKN